VRYPRAIVPVALAVVGGSAALVPAFAGARSCPLAPLIPCDALRPPGVTPEPEPSPGARAPAKVKPPLSIGLTESDPRLLVPGGTASRAAVKVAALRPAYIRVLVPWERFQPRAAQAPDWDTPPGGCPDTATRCASDLGLRGLLRAIKRRQDADGGWKILVVPYFTPPWAASRITGCQRARNRRARAQMPLIGPYREFLRRLNALADTVGVKIDYVTPWNEPNYPAFLQPQRATCNSRSKAIAPLAYAKLARAARHVLRPDQTLVLGSLAGFAGPRTYGAGAAEFIRGLPRDVACIDGPFAQHAYVGERSRHGRAPVRANPAAAARYDLIDEVLAALDAKGCPQVKQLWIAETGTFDHRCEAMSAALRSWADHDRIDAAFQYTFREAQAFPVGLVSPSLRETYKSYRAWMAFAGGPQKLPPNPC
jgi:hypothetical protein